MSAPDELAGIEPRLAAHETPGADGIVESKVRDRSYLLSVVREQGERLEKLEAVASDFAERGERIQEQFDGIGSIHAARTAGLGDGYREAARRIRAALGLAMENPVDHATPAVDPRPDSRASLEPGVQGSTPGAAAE
ncbi:hypothetical protein AB4089_22760 [Arthrobacter sp. 2MCAF15]|uniref:hypothetical protein n=1 Tax=Arthrobacter sp. 2MCAF15 TaxID=3232984 RepID=UPI003F8ED7BF